MTTDTEWAYLAGLFDGDGCVHMKQDGFPQIVIRMTEGDWEDIARGTGYGRFYSRESKYRKVREWRITRVQEVIDFLEDLLPYLQVKHQIATDMNYVLTHLKPKERRQAFANSTERKQNFHSHVKWTTD